MNHQFCTRTVSVENITLSISAHVLVRVVIARWFEVFTCAFDRKLLAQLCTYSRLCAAAVLQFSVCVVRFSMCRTALFLYAGERSAMLQRNLSGGGDKKSGKSLKLLPQDVTKFDSDWGCRSLERSPIPASWI